MKQIMKIFVAMSFAAVLALGVGYAQSTQEVAVTRASLEKAETAPAAKTTVAACCEGENANRNRCCVLSRANAMRSQTVQVPAGEIQAAEISEAVKNNAARKPEAAETKQN